MVKFIRKIVLSPMLMIIGIPLLMNTVNLAQTGPLAEVKHAVQTISHLRLPTEAGIRAATQRSVSSFMMASNTSGGSYYSRPVYVSGGPIFLN